MRRSVAVGDAPALRHPSHRRLQPRRLVLAMKREQRTIERVSWIQDYFLVGDSLFDSIELKHCTPEQQYIVQTTDELLKKRLELMRTEMRYFK
jgi:hypothetical protein